MGLFSDLNLSVTTKFGTFGLAGGTPSVSLSGDQPQLPQYTQPAPAGGAVPWYKQPLVLAAMAGGVLVLILSLRR